MTRIYAAIMLLVLLPPSAFGDFSGKVVGVSDGDTISVMRKGRAAKVRLFGIDCPEKHQDFGARAKQFTSELVFDQTVQVKVKDTDRYGRLVAEVLLPDGRSLNEALLSAGLAWWYRRYAPENKKFELLESQARRERRGLWSMKNPVPPWEFRRSQRARPERARSGLFGRVVESLF